MRLHIGIQYKGITVETYLGAHLHESGSSARSHPFNGLTFDSLSLISYITSIFADLQVKNMSQGISSFQNSREHPIGGCSLTKNILLEF